jgi:pyruvate kinase
MRLPTHKTKIVCTLGPASQTPEILAQLIEAGMNVARLNFSHGDFSAHAATIANLRAAMQSTGRAVAIMADLAGPKIRIGQFAKEPIVLVAGAQFVLSTREIMGDQTRVFVNFPRLPEVVEPSHVIFLNDGSVQLEVLRVDGEEVICRVIVGGELRSKKGLNLPGIQLGRAAFTEYDEQCLRFALAQGVDAISQSFVENAADVVAVREAARALGHETFVIAKVERALALTHIDAILRAADGIMVARGDLGIEVPIEQIPMAQKRLIRAANRLGKPVITATQMLESMTQNPRPTRAEVTDVANAILDGTDCVMLSGESAIGAYPVQAVTLLGKIAAATEPHRSRAAVVDLLEGPIAVAEDASLRDVIAQSVAHAVRQVRPAMALVPTLTGAAARSIARFDLPVWIVAVTPREATARELQFSYGVYAEHAELPRDWAAFARQWLALHELSGERVLLSGNPSEQHPTLGYRMEILELGVVPGQALRLG